MMNDQPKTQMTADTDLRTLTATEYKAWEAQMPQEVKEKWHMVIKAENNPQRLEAFDELLRRAAQPKK